MDGCLPVLPHDLSREKSAKISSSYCLPYHHNPLLYNTPIFFLLLTFPFQTVRTSLSLLLLRIKPGGGTWPEGAWRVWFLLFTRQSCNTGRGVGVPYWVRGSQSRSRLHTWGSLEIPAGSRHPTSSSFTPTTVVSPWIHRHHLPALSPGDCIVPSPLPSLTTDYSTSSSMIQSHKVTVWNCMYSRTSLWKASSRILPRLFSPLNSKCMKSRRGSHAWCFKRASYAMYWSGNCEVTENPASIRIYMVRYCRPGWIYVPEL